MENILPKEKGLLTLADLAGSDETTIKEYLATHYSGEESGFAYGSIEENDIAEAKIKLEPYNILIAYQHVGSWGCDSAAWYLLQHKETKEYAEISGGHCSCYGFEGQLNIEPTNLDYLQSEKFSFCYGGYDDESEINNKAVKDYLKGLVK